MAASQSIWLLRHGATEWSRNGRHTGSSDIPLLPDGEKEAQALAPRLSGQSFAQVWVSPLPVSYTHLTLPTIVRV